MELKTIDELELVSSLFDGCCFAIVQNGETKRVTFQTIREMVANGEEITLKLDSKIEGAKVNGATQPIVNKIVEITVPTKTSDLENDSDFVDKEYVDTEIEQEIAELESDVADITNELANKQEKLTAGSNITIDDNNIISATGGGGGGGGSNVTMSDNADGGVDLDVEGVVRTLAKEEDFKNLSTDFKSANTMVIDDSQKRFVRLVEESDLTPINSAIEELRTTLGNLDTLLGEGVS
ncbi:hypothetical protein [Priestia megaterium]|uniref:hypothetical protein n=1 Tax=Priestia megaterium TaxID=1404 RepID=UPI002E1B0D76|nr:hypothetical protein [Priestia megaterium]